MVRDLNHHLLNRFPNELVSAENQFFDFVYRNNGIYEVDLGGYLSWISQNPHHTPQTAIENAVSSFLAKEIMAVATSKHVGKVDETETYFLQYGVNYFNQPVTLLLIGGTIYHKCRDQEPGYLEDLSVIANGALFNPRQLDILRPQGKILLDAKYLVSILGGLYGRVYPEQALRIMKSELLPLELSPQQILSTPAV